MREKASLLIRYNVLSMVARPDQEHELANASYLDCADRTKLFRVLKKNGMPIPEYDTKYGRDGSEVYH